MKPASPPSGALALRGAMVTFDGDPFVDPAGALRYESDAVVVVEDGRVSAAGSWTELRGALPAGIDVTHYPDALILPGFIDCHVHYPQTGIIGAFGRQLIDWLREYTFVAEQGFGDHRHARVAADLFLGECLRAGTTTAAVFCTVHPESVDAFFEASAALGMRNIAGKVLMDRNAPAALTETPEAGAEATRELIARWHGRGRALYAVTPRFAPTSSPEQMELAGKIWADHPGTYLQSHVSETRQEVEWVRSLFPGRAGYVDVYRHFGQLGPRAIFGHGIHLTEAEREVLSATGTAIAHCPTSNLFLGSGLFNVAQAVAPSRPIRVGLGTDLGAGTSFSQFATMNEAYKVAQLCGHALSAREAFYLATRGAARALYLDDTIGSISPGMEADMVVLDLKATPLLAYRAGLARGIDEVLFVLMTLGDDRAVRSTWIGGKPAYVRADEAAASWP